MISFDYRIKAPWSNSALENLQSQAELKLTNKLNKCQFARLAAIAELEFLSERGHSDRSPSAFLEEKNNPALLPSDENESTFKALLFPDKEWQPSESLSTQALTSQQLEEAKQKLHTLEQELQEKQEKLSKQENFSLLLLTHRLLPPGPPLNGTEDSLAMRILGSPKTLTELEANYRELIKREHPDVSVHELETATSRFMYVRSLYRFTRKHWEKFKPTAVITATELERRLKASVPFPPESFWAL